MILNNVNEKAVEVDGLFEMMHEVKNSIAVCSGYLDIIDSNVGRDINKYLSIIRSEINRSRSIIKDFMLLKKEDINMEEMDISILIGQLCEEMSYLIDSKGIIFENEIVDDEVYIVGDYDRLKQVFINLVKNSMESIDHNDGKIKITSYLEEGYYFVVVKDNGSGMSDDILEKIGTDNFTTKIYGNGIGVNFCKKVMMEHGGDIEYNSKIGFGTEVIVKLPIIMI